MEGGYEYQILLIQKGVGLHLFVEQGRVDTNIGKALFKLFEMRY